MSLSEPSSLANDNFKTQTTFRIKRRRDEMTFVVLTRRRFRVRRFFRDKLDPMVSEISLKTEPKRD